MCVGVGVEKNGGGNHSQKELQPAWHGSFGEW